MTCKIMTGELYRKCRQKRSTKEKNRKQEKEKKSWWGKKNSQVYLTLILKKIKKLS